MELTRRIWELMDPHDQATYASRVPGIEYFPAKDYEVPFAPTPKSGDSEKAQQKKFANWLKTENDEHGRDIPYEWHPTHTKSRTTPGCGDFWVGVNRHSMWLEFKADYSCELSPVQKEFRRKCLVQGILYFVVYSASEAIAKVEEYDRII